MVKLVRGDLEIDKFKNIRLTDESKELFKNLFPPKGPELDKSEGQSAEEKASANKKTVELEPVKKELESKSEKESLSNLKELKNHFTESLRKFIFFDTFEALLPGEVKIIDIDKYPAVLDFQKVFKADFADIVKKESRAISREDLRLIKVASDDLNTYWTQKLEEDGKYNFNVKIMPQADENLSKVEFKVDRDDGDPLFLEQKSRGFRWFSAFNLRLRALGADPETIKNLVILIDEPGQGLHEKAQNDVKKVIEELAEMGAQVIYTTHYPNLIGTEGIEFARIRVVSNTKKLGTKVETVSQFAAKAGQGGQDALSPLITAMGIHSVGSVFDSKRLNVVVEGITDHYYFSAFKKLFDKDDRLYFLPACGVNNIPNLVSVLVGWGCNYKAVFDDDKESGRKAYRLLKNKFYEGSDTKAQGHILKIKGCRGIEDIFTRTDFSKFVLSEKITQGTKEPNSKIANGRKEILARIFLEKTENNEVKLGATTTKKVNQIFDWLYKKFKISTISG